MALSVSFTAQSVAGVASDILFTDTSSGSDGSIVVRRIYTSTDTGEFLVEEGTSTDYELWDFADTSIQLNLLTKDRAVKMYVEWRNGTDVVVYDYTIDAQGFTQYNENASFQLTQALTGNPLLINDNNFAQNKWALRDFIDSGNQAILQASDLYSAQRCYDLGTDIRLNSQYLFNQNS